MRMKRSAVVRIMRRLAALASGGVLLQTGGCTIDEDLLTDLVNLALEAFLTSLTTTT